MSDKKQNLSSEERRKAVRNILAGTGAVAGAASSPAWVKPAIDAVILPAHAQMSGPLVFPKVLVGNASGALVNVSPVQPSNSILDTLIEPAYAGNSMAEPSLEGACLSMDIPDEQNFTLTLTFTSGSPIVVTGTVSAAGALAGTGGGVTVAGTADLQANTASGTVSNSNGTHNFSLDDTQMACTPMDPTTTTTTTTTPTTTTTSDPCGMDYTYREGNLGYTNNIYNPYDINMGNAYGYGYSCFDDRPA